MNEDQAMQNEVYEDLRNKYEKMAEGDEKKMKLLKIKKELHEK